MSSELPRFKPRPGRELFMENSVLAAFPGYSAVISRPGLYLVEGKATREGLAIALFTAGPWNGRTL